MIKYYSFLILLSFSLVLATDSMGSKTKSSGSLFSKVNRKANLDLLNANSSTIKINEEDNGKVLYPADGSKYHLGAVVNFSGVGSPSEEKLPASSFSWILWAWGGDDGGEPEAIFTHTGKSGSLVLPDSYSFAMKSAGFWLIMYVKDSKGNIINDFGYTTVQLDYHKPSISITTEPSGIHGEVRAKYKNEIEESYGGSYASLSALPGAIANINVPYLFSLGGKTYQFSHWQHGGKQNQQFTVGTRDREFKAIFKVVTVQEPLLMRIQAETRFQILADVGGNKIVEEKNTALDNGSSVRVFDTGDKFRVRFNVGFEGKYIVKVRLRSGYYTSVKSDPTSYWPAGYSFWINNKSTTFTGNPKSISGKIPVFGGSYFGTMASSPIFLTEGDNFIDIRANKDWAGIDYIELINVSTKLEAETESFIWTDTGKRPVGEVKSPTLSGGSSIKIFDKGDMIAFSLNLYAGKYIIKARVRSGFYDATNSKPTSYWPNGYKFLLDHREITLVGDNSTLSRKDASYGGSYWGTMVSAPVTLSEFHHYFSILAEYEWGGVDYIEVIPVYDKPVVTNSARLAANEEEQKTTLSFFPNPFINSINIVFPLDLNEKAIVTLFDTNGNIKFQESRELRDEDNFAIDLSSKNLKPGLYLLKVKTSLEEKVVRLSKE